jgi:hypothetical protein
MVAAAAAVAVDKRNSSGLRGAISNNPAENLA